MRSPCYELINGGSKGRLLSNYAFWHSLTGHRVTLDRDSIRADLYRDGRLIIYSGSEWDFGTGAIDDKAMVISSLEHDPLTKMTNLGLLPWSCRFLADKQLWRRLGECGGTIFRLWRVPVVMIYSQTLARWGRIK